MGNFTERTKAPTVAIDWYRNQDWGGYSLAMPIDDEGFCLPNCVGYANGRQNEAIIEIMKTTTYNNNDMIYDAEQIYDYCKGIGRPVGYAPKRGGCMCWANPDTGGHIAFVEQVIDENNVVITESGYGYFLWQRTEMNSDNNWTLPWDDYMNYTYQGCVYLPAEVQKVLDGGTPVPPPGKHTPCDYMIVSWDCARGKYGNPGPARDDQLRKAGYDPAQIACCIEQWVRWFAYYN